MELKITLKQLENLMDEQKRNVIESLASSTSYYNNESTDSHSKSLPINKDKFFELGMAAKYPDDLKVLKRYIG